MVKVWFQNRRTKYKRQKIEEKVTKRKQIRSLSCKSFDSTTIDDSDAEENYLKTHENNFAKEEDTDYSCNDILSSTSESTSGNFPIF
ncbi:unnamed protein product [Clavelina lepadiformis]|uniref:Homeobox domain-containing protein n=1 Tax=Clavelina lepadiformis TaxID=159417 RepID=A0ABP0G4M8_CLALP